MQYDDTHQTHPIHTGWSDWKQGSVDVTVSALYYASCSLGSYATE